MRKGIYSLPESHLWFPTSDLFPDDEDIVAIGGDLSLERLLTAYLHGIFPWYNNPGEIIWWCPRERCVLFLDQLIVSHSMRNEMNKNRYRITMDTAFGEVLEGCRGGEREGQTWLLDEMVESYMQLHKHHIAHSVEVWEKNELVGGLYGVSIGKIFFGESMFSRKSNTSKLAFIKLAQYLRFNDFILLDCQIVTPHLQSLGAVGVPRKDYLDLIARDNKLNNVKSKWTESFEKFTSLDSNVK